MSEELLRIDKLPTIKEFNFLLLEVLNRDTPIPQYDLSSICKTSSINFALSFDNSIRFLSEISLITINPDNTISRSLYVDDLQLLKDEYSLCLFITKRLINYLYERSLLEKVFNTKIVKFDPKHDSFSINVNAMPLEYPLIKEYLINMGIAYPEHNSKGRILILNIYRPFFLNEIINKVVNEDGTIEFDTDSILGVTPKNKSLFISYSHIDDLIKKELIKHLSGLKRMGLINEWNDRSIMPGEQWDKEIKERLELADIVLFLISSDFMSSDYINDVEISRAVERHNKKLTIIVPVIVRPCDFASLPISKYQALPKDAKPISKWDDQDEALLDVVNGIKKLLVS